MSITPQEVVFSHPYVLHGEDNKDDARFFRRAFAKVAGKTELRHFPTGTLVNQFLDSVMVSKQSLPKLVILDIKMPGRSGLEVLEHIRRAPSLRHLPVIILSSSNEASDLDRAYVHSANAYLVKPVRYQDLSQLIESLSVFWLGYNRLP